MPPAAKCSCHKKKRCRQVTHNFDEVMDAWDTQIRYYTRKSIEIEYVVDTHAGRERLIFSARRWWMTVLSELKSIKQGGAKYDRFPGLQVGIASLGKQPGGSEVKKLSI